MNVAKFIRLLGYILYTVLWLPVIVVVLVLFPIVEILLAIRAGTPVKEAVKAIKTYVTDSIKHDMKFIKTGEW